MTKKTLFTGMLAMALVFGLVLTGCDLFNTADPQYTLTYNANGGTGTTPSSLKVNSGTEITLGKMDGASFSGWNTRADGGGTSYDAGASFTVTTDITLYAKWTLGGSGVDNQSGVDYTSHNSDYSILTRSNVNKKLVAFKGMLSEETLIGGIPAHASNHGLPKDSKLFNKNEDFPLILLTEEQYLENKGNLKALEDTPFTRIFAFYNASGTNENVYEISGKLGGDNVLYIQNPTSMNVEIRLNGINGETLGYAATGMLNTKLFLTPGDYNIFPVFKKYNSVRDEIITVYPKGAEGYAMNTQFQLGEGTSEISFNTSSYLTNQSYSTGTAWLIIDNQADTGIQLQKGGVIQRTATGIATINNGFSRTFQVDMAKVGTTYDTSAKISAYQVGTAAKLISIGNHELSVDKMYKVTVTGSANQNTLAVTEPEEVGDISLDDF
ncbi:MAG: InlB B-repeat-containing protein [Treponema sp.]|jgi:hypothetical protein|nr:InlB B-repeat-containing protein [Treponema sp.]